MFRKICQGLVAAALLVSISLAEVGQEPHAKAACPEGDCGGRRGVSLRQTDKGRTVDRRPHAFSFNRTHSLDFLLAVPKYKLLFCFIPKNGCTQFNTLMNGLNGLGINGEAPHFLSGAVRRFHWTEDAISEELKGSSWYKAVFLRDPLERLLSGYASKCEPRLDGIVEDGGKHCLNFAERASAAQAPPFADFVKSLSAAQLLSGGLQDAHFREQGDFCGGLRVEDYDFVGNFEGELHPQVSNLLQNVGAGSQQWLVDKLFPMSGDRKALKQNRVTGASDPRTFNTYYHTLETLVGAYNIYKSDYRRLYSSVRSRAEDQGKICITSAVALNFEKFRVLDWVAYHNLMGVNCFILFVDRRRSDMSDRDVLLTYQSLLALPEATVFDIENTQERIPLPRQTADLAEFLGARYLAPFDVDEYAVLEEPSSEGGEQGSPPDLHAFLQNSVASRGALGVYLHRLDFGTSGFVDPPPLATMPEFMLLTERRERIEKKGKPILDLHSGVEFIGVHTWGVPISGGEMLLPNGSRFECSPKCLCPDNDTMASARACFDPSTCVEEKCNLQQPQRLVLNHYVSGSLSECLEKLDMSTWHRRTARECERFHMGDGFLKDFSMMPFGWATRARRERLFGSIATSRESGHSQVNLHSLGEVGGNRLRASTLVKKRPDVARSLARRVLGRSSANLLSTDLLETFTLDEFGDRDPGNSSNGTNGSNGTNTTTPPPVGFAQYVRRDEKRGVGLSEAGHQQYVRRDEKRGVGLSEAGHQQGDVAAFGSIGWYYNLELVPFETPPKVEFVPTVAGPAQVATLEDTPPHPSSRHLLTFAGPNIAGTSHSLSPAAACALWPQVLSYAKLYQLKVVAPACSYCNASADANCDMAANDWLKAFFKLPSCGPDTVQAIAVQISGGRVADALETVWRVHNEYEKPVWVQARNVSDMHHVKQLRSQFALLPSSVLERYALHAEAKEASRTLLEWGSSEQTAFGMVYDA